MTDTITRRAIIAWAALVAASAAMEQAGGALLLAIIGLGVAAGAEWYAWALRERERRQQAHKLLKSVSAPTAPAVTQETDAVLAKALQELGYRRREAQAAIARANPDPSLPLEEQLRVVLKTQGSET